MFSGGDDDGDDDDGDGDGDGGGGDGDGDDGADGDDTIFIKSKQISMTYTLIKHNLTIFQPLV